MRRDGMVLYLDCTDGYRSLSMSYNNAVLDTCIKSMPLMLCYNSGRPSGKLTEGHLGSLGTTTFANACESLFQNKKFVWEHFWEAAEAHINSGQKNHVLPKGI